MEEKKAFEQKRNVPFGLKPQNASGARPEKVVQLFLKDPQARAVAVTGTFNHWDIRSPKYLLAKDSQGCWRVSLSLKPGQYEYRFFVDGHWADDPQAAKTVQNKFGTMNAVLEVK